MSIYNNYRRMLPPSSMWDPKARYSPIGKRSGQDEHDDIFLVSALNHHVSIIRARVPQRLLEALDGADETEGWDRLLMWRSKWYDLFLKEDRIQAMQIIWGMMAYLMRKIDEPAPEYESTDKMDVDK